MKRLIISILCLFPTLILNATKHEFDSGFFYEKHKEPRSSYEFTGIVLDYKFQPSQGFGIKGQVRSNLSVNEFFIETHSCFLFTFGENGFKVRPFIGTKSTSHLALIKENHDYYLKKNWIESGLEFDSKITGNLQSVVTFEFLNHISHNLLIVKPEHIKVRNLVLQNGFLTKLNIKGFTKIGFFYELEGYFSQDFRKIYRTVGGCTKLGWDF